MCFCDFRNYEHLMTIFSQQKLSAIVQQRSFPILRDVRGRVTNNPRRTLPWTADRDCSLKKKIFIGILLLLVYVATCNLCLHVYIETHNIKGNTLILYNSKHFFYSSQGTRPTDIPEQSVWPAYPAIFFFNSINFTYSTEVYMIQKTRTKWQKYETWTDRY